MFVDALFTNLLLTDITFSKIHDSSSSNLYSLGKEQQCSVCDTPGRKDDVGNLEATSNDVLEVPDASVKLPSARAIWTYGTIGLGIDHVPGVWKDHKHCFASHRHEILPSHASQATQLGPPGRVKPNVLNKHPVDCLLVEGHEPSLWKPWIERS
jgi:hypothetical protein